MVENHRVVTPGTYRVCEARSLPIGTVIKTLVIGEYSEAHFISLINRKRVFEFYSQRKLVVTRCRLLVVTTSGLDWM